MRITGIILLVIGGLCLIEMILTLLLPDGRDANLPFVQNTWTAIVASFFIPSGAALYIASKKKKRMS